MNFALPRLLRRRRNSLLPARDSHLKLGVRGERLAARHLKRLGFRILGTRYVCPAGEIDLIVSDGETIVFVEVKTRTESDFDSAFRVRNPQQVRILRAGRYFVREMGVEHRPCRFDVIHITWPESGKPTIEHFEDALRVGKR